MSNATSWLEGLAARGVRLSVRGKKLVLTPKSAYSELSADERKTLKQHKAAIVAIVRAGTYAPASRESQSATAPREPCPHCYRAPCIGERHALYDLLHPLTERQAFERRMAQWEKDKHEMKVRQLFGLPSPTWDL